jgi:electron transport complex protein RnfD
MSHTPISGPHTHTRNSVARTMLWVQVALLPSAAFGIYLFGWPALFLLGITVGSTVMAEAICLRLAGRPLRLFLSDGSAILTGLLLALSLPPWAPWWIGIIGAFFAIIIGKHVFGGLGQNLFNPAMLGRIALLIAFPVEMTRWTSPTPIGSDTAPDVFSSLGIIFNLPAWADNIDAFTSATTLGHIKTELTQGHGLSQSLHAHFLGHEHLMGFFSGSLGETSAPLILAGGIFLLFKGIIRWPIPVALLSTIVLCSSLMHFVDAERYPNALYHLLSGATMLGAFFIATDPVGSPNTPAGQLIFGAGCGLLIYMIRTWGSFPEGMAFAVVLMNAFTPLIDHYIKPRIYGRTHRGSPIPVSSSTARKRPS